MPEIYLKVDSAYPEDQGAGKARLDPDTMLQLRLNPGDLVAIEGKRRTVAKVWRAMVNDWHQGKVRIDNFTRLNTGASIGDRVKIKTLDEEAEAKRVVLAPPEDLPKQLPINYGSVVNKLIDFPIVKNDSVPIQAGLPFMQPQLVAFKAVVVEPENAVIITKNTKIEFSEKPAAGFEGVKRISYEDIGGLKGELQRVRETIELPMRHPEIFRKLGIEPPKGVLLYGPPGTGKTLIAKAVASESGAHFISIAGPEVISKYYGESEQRLREVFEDARQHAPAIIFIDELDSIAPRREEVTGEVERRVVAQLLTMMDGLEERGQVVVIGATNRLDAIDPALRRPGRFDREIEIGVPSEDDRTQVLHIHTRGMPLADDVTISSIAQQTHGFVGADLAALAREAAIKALRRYLPEIDLEAEEIPPETLEKMEVQARDFRDALRDVGPSAMREILLEVPHTTWEDVGGLEEAKQEIREAVEYPLTRRERFENLSIEPPKGVLLYGPPGTGKTLIAKAVASESGANFIPVKGPQLLSKWVGESERAVREVFKKARQVAPSIIFFDEFDALAPARGGGSESHVVESVLNQILTEIDGLEELRGVVVMGATNRPDMVDPALLRPGRFDRLVYIGEPGWKDRQKILSIHTRYIPLEGSTMGELVAITEKLSENELEDLILAVKTNNHVSIQYLRNQLARNRLSAIAARKDEGFQRELRRRKLVDLLSRQEVSIKDSTAEGLMEMAEEIWESELSDLTLAVRARRVNTEDVRNQLASHQFTTSVARKEKGLQHDVRRRILIDLLSRQKVPIEGSIIEDLVKLTEGLSENELHDLIQSIGINYRRKAFKILANYMPTIRDSAIEDLANSTEGITETELEDLFCAIGTNNQEDIRKTHTRYRSIKDSTIEDLMRLAEGLLKSRLNDLILAIWVNHRKEIFAILTHHMPTIKDSAIVDLVGSTEKITENELEELFRVIGTKNQEKIRESFLHYAPTIKDSTIGDLVKLTEGLSEDTLKDMIRDAMTTYQESIEDVGRLLDAIAPDGEKLESNIRRKKLVDLLAQQKVTLDDPVRDRLLEKIAAGTEGFVGSDLEALAREAGMLAMREGAPLVNPSHFEKAREKVHATMNERLRQYYGKVQQHFKGGLPKDIQPPEYQ